MARNCFGDYNPDKNPLCKTCSLRKQCFKKSIKDKEKKKDKEETKRRKNCLSSKRTLELLEATSVKKQTSLLHRF